MELLLQSVNTLAGKCCWGEEEEKKLLLLFPCRLLSEAHLKGQDGMYLSVF